MTRRELLQLTGAQLALAAVAPGATEPENLSYPLSLLEDRITPRNRFFVRDHFRPPEVALDGWRLRIEGRVTRAYELNFSDLVEMPSGKLEAVLECAGNLAGGSAVSNGVWEGVPMARLLEEAKPLDDAAFVLLEGADSGQLFEGDAPLPYARLLPLDKCMEKSSMVAFKLNDQMLPAQNGFPARAFFPGWYGMDSVKWLRKMTLVSANDHGTIFHKSGMTRLYTRVESNGATRQVTRLSQTQVKSVVAWPGDGMKLPAGRHLVRGFAWSGAGGVKEVSISTDGGASWNAARFPAPPNQYAWAQWSYEWAAKPGEYALLSRAMDDKGRQQPLHRASERKDQYELNWCAPQRCTVR